VPFHGFYTYCMDLPSPSHLQKYGCDDGTADDMAQWYQSHMITALIQLWQLYGQRVRQAINDLDDHLQLTPDDSDLPHTTP